LFSFFRGETPLKRENVKERVFMWRGVAGCPRRVGSGIKYGGEAAIFYVAREGVALPLYMNLILILDLCVYPLKIAKIRTKLIFPPLLTQLQAL
jgi:hypothetical protein